MTNIPECGIINYLLINSNYNKYYNYININYIKNNYKELYLIYDALTKWHLSKQRDTTIDELHIYFLTLHPGLEDKQRKIYDDIFSTIRSSSVLDGSAESMVKAIQTRDILTSLALEAYNASQSGQTAKVSELASKLLQPVGQLASEPISWITDNLEELYIGAVKTPGLRWRLSSLNQSLGSLRRGDFGFIFARPETGKTTFLASEISHMASQVETPILWFNNEEQGTKVMLRCYQASLGLRLEQLLSDIPKHQLSFNKLTKGRIKIYDSATITRSEAEQVCQAVKPSLIIFDQIDKISGFAADRNDLELGAIYNWARELAKTYAPVIGVCQADGTGEGIKWLTMGNVSNAKTSKQAEADWILGIGRSNDVGYESVRHFNISKNKLIGDKDSLPELRHAQWDVKFQPEIARYSDFLKD